LGVCLGCRMSRTLLQGVVRGGNAVESFDDALECLRHLVRVFFVRCVRCVSSYLEDASYFEVNIARKG